MIIQISKDVYDKLSDSEKIVVNYLNENEKNIPSMSITTIAEKTFTSPATVSRAIQKCGFKGINELRYDIANQSQKKIADTYVVNEILAKSFRECTMTIDNLAITNVLKIIGYIKESKRTFLFARGFTALVAEEFQMQLQLLGYNATLVKDATWMSRTNQLVDKEDVVIFLSVQATTPELATSAKMAKQKGAKVVVCICKEGTTLEKYADVTLMGHAETIVGTNSTMITVVSRLPLTIMCRTIIEYLNL